MPLKGVLGSFQKIISKDEGITDDARCVEQMGWMIFLKLYDSREFQWELQDEQFISIIPEPLRWRNWAMKKALTGDALLKFVNEELFPGLKALPVTPQTFRRQSMVRTVFEDLTQHMKDGSILRQAIDALNTADFQARDFYNDFEALMRSVQDIPSLGWAYTPPAVTDFIAGHLPLESPATTITDLSAGVCEFLISIMRKKQARGPIPKRWFIGVHGAEADPVAYLLGVTNLLLYGMNTPRIYHGSVLGNSVADTTVGRFDIVLMRPNFDGTASEEMKANFPEPLRSDRMVDLFAAMASFRLTKNGCAALILPDDFLSGMEPQQVAIRERLLNKFNLHTIIRLPATVFAPYTNLAANILFFDRRKWRGTWFYRLDLPEGYKRFSKTKPILQEHFADCEAWWKNRSEIQDAGGFKAKFYPLKELAKSSYNLDLCGYPKRKKS